MSDITNLYKLLQLNPETSLFFEGMKLDTFDFVLRLNFCHFSGSFQNPSIGKFTMMFRKCNNIKISIDASEEDDNRPEYMRTYLDVLGINLGEKDFISPFSLHCSEIEVSFNYADFTVHPKENLK